MRILTSVLLCVAYMGALNLVDYTFLQQRTENAAKQLEENNQLEVRQEAQQFNTIGMVGWIAVLLVAGLIAWPDIKSLYKNVAAILIICACLTSSGCYRPYEPIKLVEIAPNEEAFLIPYVGDAAKQTSSNNEEYLKKNLVFTKQIKLPQQWIQTGYQPWWGKWEDAAILVKVDKAPITREWTADEASGTSNKNEAIWVMTADQVEFSTGWTCTARIQSREDAVKFLHNYPNGSLQSVLDHEVRAKLQSTFALEVTDLPMEKLRIAATPHIENTVKTVEAFFTPRGISITNLGITGGFVYKDNTIRDMMVKVFNAEQEKSIAIAESNAQAERNKKIQLTADSKAKALLTEKEAEAEGIKAVAEAKAFELEKATQDKETYLTLKRLEVTNKQIEKWDGKFPNTFMGQENPSNILMPLPQVKE